MDARLFDFIHQQVPAFNRLVCDGLAVTHLEHAERYVDRLFLSAQSSFPRGLKYLGYTRCTPHEQFAVSTKMRNSKRPYEVRRSDVYMVKYLFTLNGEEIRPVYFYLPYAMDGGIIHLNGSTFAISPVLADQTISVGVDSMFIRLYRDKLTFNRSYYPFIIDGERTNSDIIISNIHHGAKKSGKKRINGLDATPVHYLFCKYGVMRTFREFGKTDIVVGKDDITTERFPRSEWRICSSIGLRPRGIRDKLYQPTRIRIAIRNEDYNLTSATMIASFFYLVDHFPDRVEPEYIDDLELWMVFMGYNTCDLDATEGKMIISIQSHIESLDHYIDAMSKDDLNDIGISVNDIYQLFGHVIETMSSRVAKASTSVSSMYGKKLIVLFYVLEDISHAITNMHFAMKKKSKNGTKDLSMKEVNDIMMKHLKPETIMMLNRPTHPECQNVPSSTDNKIFRITGKMVLQASAMSKMNNGGTAPTDNLSNILHASQAEIASFTNLPKSEPTGRDRLNMYARVEANGTISRNPDFVQLLDTIQQHIQR